MIEPLFTVLEKHGNTKLAERVKELIDKPKKDQVDGLEKLIQECKSKDIQCDQPTFQLIKNVYRVITS